MGFLDELRAYLREVERTGVTAVEAVAPDPTLVDLVRQRVFDHLRRVERERPDLLEEFHGRWTAPGEIRGWTGLVVGELDRGLASGDDDALRRGLDLCVATAFGHQASREPATLEELEAQRIVRRAFNRAYDLDARTYASEVGLIRPRASTLSESARTFLELAGTDAVAFLLHLETILSTGWDDRWRVHRSLLKELRAADPLLFLGMHDLRMMRLRDLDLLDDDRDERGEWGWFVPVEARRIFDDVLADPPSPMHALAKAAVDDDLDRIVHGAATSPSARTDATLEMSRVVAHEIRNALGPVRAAVQRFIRAAGDAVAADRREELEGRIFRGLDRLDKFVADIARFTDVGERPSTIDVAAAVEEALAATELERNGHLVVKRQLEEARVVGPRSRFGIALVNLVRNAAQAAGDRTLELRIEVTAAADTVTVAFDDDGPGVPADQRARIFEPGVSLRGGTGLGLAHVRAVVEEEMGGRVGYNVSERGGARFVLELPRAPEESP